MATPNPYGNFYQPYQGGPRRASFTQQRADGNQTPNQDASRQLVDALLEAGQDLSGQAGYANTYGQGGGGQQSSISPGAANNIMDMAQGLFGGGGSMGATGSLYGDTSGIAAGNPWADSLIFDSNFSALTGGSAGGGSGASAGGAAAGAGGGSAAGSSAGGGSALASAGPWAALAALILGNESEAKQGGYRDENDWDYAQDVLGGKVSEQDAHKRWVPKIADDWLGDEGDRFGMQADMWMLFDLLTGDFSNFWDTLNDDSSIARIFGGDFGSKRDDSFSMRAKANR